MMARRVDGHDNVVMPKTTTFLTASWFDLAMLHYIVDPAILLPLVPPRTELDFWDGDAIVSLVGFRFLDTRVLGFSVPGHRNFDEVNLRFYVRRRAHDGWHRGVVFVKEIVPRRAVAWLANALYNERYVALPMNHEIVPALNGSVPYAARYEWDFRGRWHKLSVTAGGTPFIPRADSVQAFLVNRHWGYARQRDGATIEYQVEHAPWTIREATESALDCDVVAMYGAPFAPFLSAAPYAAFMADGSTVTVGRGVRLEADQGRLIRRDGQHLQATAIRRSHRDRSARGENDRTERADEKSQGATADAARSRQRGEHVGGHHRKRHRRDGRLKTDRARPLRVAKDGKASREPGAPSWPEAHGDERPDAIEPVAAAEPADVPQACRDQDPLASTEPRDQREPGPDETR